MIEKEKLQNKVYRKHHSFYSFDKKKDTKDENLDERIPDFIEISNIPDIFNVLLY